MLFCCLFNLLSILLSLQIIFTFSLIIYKFYFHNLILLIFYLNLIIYSFMYIFCFHNLILFIFHTDLILYSFIYYFYYCWIHMHYFYQYNIYYHKFIFTLFYNFIYLQILIIAISSISFSISFFIILNSYLILSNTKIITIFL